MRTKEIGIRKALGASSRSIFILLSREFITLVAISVIVAWHAWKTARMNPVEALRYE